MIRTDVELASLDGFRSTVTDETIVESAPDTTTDDYSRRQQEGNVRVTREYLEPIMQAVGARSVLDVGCGVGTGVETLLEDGYEAYGVDLPGLVPHWSRLGHPRERFFVVGPWSHRLPFADGSLDFAYTLGVMEHIGTLDGHATRAADYHEERGRWVREIFRTLRVGGHLLLGGPNKGFPLDFSHGLDAAASRPERVASRAAGFTVHRTWGHYFLWSYADVDRYLQGLKYEVVPLRIGGLLKYSRVPGPFRWFAHFYIDHLPEPLLGTGFNPWVMALVRRLG